jgi:hypothetical protein
MSLRSLTFAILLLTLPASTLKAQTSSLYWNQAMKLYSAGDYRAAGLLFDRFTDGHFSATILPGNQGVYSEIGQEIR